MIACKLAAIVPDRVRSLALLNVMGGGFECFPKVLSLFRYLALGCVQLSLNYNSFMYVNIINICKHQMNANLLVSSQVNIISLSPY